MQREKRGSFKVIPSTKSPCPLLVEAYFWGYFDDNKAIGLLSRTLAQLCNSDTACEFDYQASTFCWSSNT